VTPEHCLTCADEAVAGVVQELDGDDAIVLVPGGRERVALDLVDGVDVGETLLCHAGIALARVPSEERVQ
jgi:hydrogenase maturation factor